MVDSKSELGLTPGSKEELVNLVQQYGFVPLERRDFKDTIRDNNFVIVALQYEEKRPYVISHDGTRIVTNIQRYHCDNAIFGLEGVMKDTSVIITANPNDKLKTFTDDRRPEHSRIDLTSEIFAMMLPIILRKPDLFYNTIDNFVYSCVWPSFNLFALLGEQAEALIRTYQKT